jgi:hypothetical protein
LPGTSQKVCYGGGCVVVGAWWWVVVCKPILVFSLGFGQAEELLIQIFTKDIQSKHIFSKINSKFNKALTKIKKEKLVLPVNPFFNIIEIVIISMTFIFM